MRPLPLVALALALAALAAAPAARAQTARPTTPPTPAAPAPAWEGAEPAGPIVLALRDANATGNHRAIFTVRDRRTGRAFSRTLDVRGDARSALRFPDDFPGAEATITGAPKAYDWQCTVGGQRVLYGAFVYPYVLQRVDRD